MIKAYLSHRRENDGLSDFAQFLLDSAPKDEIDLKVDCKDAEFSRPIDIFIGELKTSSSVIFLLNDAFFKSRWCMGELCAFIERRPLSYHGFVIACDGWLQVPDIQSYYTDFEKTLLDHWTTVARDAEDEKLKCEAEAFCEKIPETVGILRRYNFPDEATIRKSEAEPIWERIRKQRNRIQPDYAPCKADDFDDECKKRVVQRLSYAPLLHRKLAVDLLVDEPAKESLLVQALWQQTVPNRLSSFYRAANEALRDSEVELREKLRDDIRDILAVLLLGFFNKEGRDKVLNPRYGMYDSNSLDFYEHGGEIPELCFASSEQTFIAHIEYDKKHLCFKVSKDRYFAEDRVAGPLRYSCDSALDSEQRLIWNTTFPNRLKVQNEYLDEGDMKRLSGRLKGNFDRGTARYYLVPADQEHHAMNQENMIEALKFNLPYLFILRTGVAGAPTLFDLDFESFDITDELDNFAKLFK